jgi:protoporphyrinogen oxidase
MDPRRIAVLGAGPMGLAVAYELALQGQRPVLFEADDRVGGMAAAFDFGGLAIERYYHFHCTSDRAFLKLLDELGLADRMRWTETTMGYWVGGRLHPWGNPLALLRFSPLPLASRIRCGLHAFASIRRNDWRDLDELEATGWIRRWVGDQAFELLWRKLFDHKFYDHAGNLSAAWIWSRIRRIGRSRYNLMREKLGYLDGGSETLLQGLRRAIEARGGELRLSQPVQQVLIEQGAVRGVRAGSGGQVQDHAFDTVISTVPLPYVPRLMPGLPAEVMAQLQSQKNIAVVCVIAKLRRRLTPHFWVNVNDPEMDIPGLVEYTNLRPLDGTHVVYVPFYMPGEHPKYADGDAVFLGKVRRYLQRLAPDLSDADILDLRASRYRHAQPICEPGHLQRLPPPKLPVQGLWVADTSYYYPEDRGISESVDFGRRMARDALA